jgi:hypothetical protein
VYSRASKQAVARKVLALNHLLEVSSLRTPTSRRRFAHAHGCSEGVLGDFEFGCQPIGSCVMKKEEFRDDDERFTSYAALQKTLLEENCIIKKTNEFRFFSVNQITEKQKNLLISFGFSESEVRNFSKLQASKMISRIILNKQLEKFIKDGGKIEKIY